MNLTGRELSVSALLAYLQERRKGTLPVGTGDGTPGVEPRVDPLSYALEKLLEHADSTRGLGIESHRSGLSGLLLVAAKRAFRAVGQPFINEALERQRLFNGHVHDAYAQLSHEVLRLRARVAELEGQRTEGGQQPREP